MPSCRPSERGGRGPDEARIPEPTEVERDDLRAEEVPIPQLDALGLSEVLGLVREDRIRHEDAFRDSVAADLLKLVTEDAYVGCPDRFRRIVVLALYCPAHRPTLDEQVDLRPRPSIAGYPLPLLDRVTHPFEDGRSGILEVSAQVIGIRPAQFELCLFPNSPSRFRFLEGWFSEFGIPRNLNRGTARPAEPRLA